MHPHLASSQTDTYPNPDKPQPNQVSGVRFRVLGLNTQH
jgi:hypothetical protein